MENVETITSSHDSKCSTDTTECSTNLQEQIPSSSSFERNINSDEAHHSSTDSVGHSLPTRKRGRPPNLTKLRGRSRRPGTVPKRKRLYREKRRKRPTDSSADSKGDSVDTTNAEEIPPLEPDTDAEEIPLLEAGAHVLDSSVDNITVDLSNPLSLLERDPASQLNVEQISSVEPVSLTSNELEITSECSPSLDVASESLPWGQATYQNSDKQSTPSRGFSSGKLTVLSSANFHDYAVPLSPDVRNPDSTPSKQLLHSVDQVPSTSHQSPSTHLKRPFDLLMEVRAKVEPFLYARWHVVVRPDAIHVLLLSTQDNLSVQRNIVCSSSGQVDLYVHCQQINVNQFLKNVPSRVSLSVNSVDKFADRIVKIVEEVRKMEVCSGYDKENVKAGWNMCTLGEIDKNPYRECRYSETFRSFNCSRLVKRNAWRCCECAKLYKPLKRRADLAAQVNPHPHTGNIFLDEEQKLQKLQTQASKLENARKKISRLREKAKLLIDKEGVKIDTDLSDSFMEILNTNSISPAQSIFLQEQIKASKQKKSVGMRWHPTLIRLSLSLYVTSPAAYEMLRDTGMVRLPSSRTLFDYGHVKPTQEGVDEVVLESLGKRIRNFQHGYQKYHVLMADEMYISQNLVFQKSNGRLLGYVNLDSVDVEVDNLENYLNDVSEEDQVPQIAQKVLVYLIKGVSSGVKEVVATYAVANMSVDQMYMWTWEVIGALERTGIAVIAFVTDGFSVNRAFIKKHKPVTVLPSGVIFDTINKAAPDRVLYFISDVPHLLKTVRNCLYSSRSKHKKKSGRRMLRNGKEITWDPIIRLYEENKKRNLRKSFKLNAMNVYPDGYARMKVKYAGQVLSRTVAQDLEDQQWENVSELIYFIRFVNDWFDCLNGAHTAVGKKTRNKNLEPYTSQDDRRFEFLLSFLDFLEQWSEEAKKADATMNATAASAAVAENVDVDADLSAMDAAEEGVDPSEEVTPAAKRILSRQTLEGIEMSTRAFILMVKFLLKEGTQFINARVFCQDPLEQHFSKVRAGQGGSTNPNVGQVLNRNRALHVVGELGMKRRRGNAAKGKAPVEVSDEPLPKRRCRRLLKI